MDEGTRLLTTTEVRDVLLRDPRLRGVAALCTLPAVRVGAEWRIRPADLEAWISGQAPEGQGRH
jgi:hypothetical protein